jgi:enoyl-CoA hydratase/carnithine racemase
MRLAFLEYEGYRDLLVEKDGPVLSVTINRPERHNALSPITQNDLSRAWVAFNEDPDLRVAVLRGAGSRAFSAGADLKWPDEFPEEFEEWEAVRRASRRAAFGTGAALSVGDMPYDTWRPIIAAVEGYCLGGGLELAMNCDIIVASTTAVFGQPEIARGWPAGSGNFNLPRHVGLKVAMDMLLTGEPISAQRAYDVGLVSRLAEPDDLMATAHELARRMATYSADALPAAKEIVLRGLDAPLRFPPTSLHLSDIVKRKLEESGSMAADRTDFVQRKQT